MTLELDVPLVDAHIMLCLRSQQPLVPLIQHLPHPLIVAFIPVEDAPCALLERVLHLVLHAADVVTPLPPRALAPLELEVPLLGEEYAPLVLKLHAVRVELARLLEVLLLLLQ